MPPLTRRLRPRDEALPCPRCSAITPLTSGECASCQEALFTTACARCGETMFAGHEFCVTCGGALVAVDRDADWAEGTPPGRALFDPDASDAPTGLREPAPPPVVARAATAYCPRCRGPLSARTVGAVDLDECHACGGVFLEAGDLSALVFDQPSALALAADLRALPALPPPRPLRGSCPVCAHALRVRVVPRLGTRALACRTHGVWFERDELLRASRVLGDGRIDARSSTDILAFLLS